MTAIARQPILTEVPSLDRRKTLSRSNCLQILGLDTKATGADIEQAYCHLVSDITPGVRAKHSRVSAANKLLAEVELAYTHLMPRAS